MKYCEEYAALLDLFVDGELPPGEMERVRAHLETCPGCRAYVDDALMIRAGFPDAEDTAVPEGFTERVMERGREDAGKSSKMIELKRRPVRRWAGSLAALAACCALVILLKTGYSNGISKSMSAGDTAAPAETSAARDAAGGGEADAAPRMAEAPAQAEVPGLDIAAPEEEQKLTAGQTETAAESDTTANDFAMDRAAGAEGAAPYTSLASLPEAAEAAAGAEEPSLRLTAGEEGDLLDGYEPVWEEDGERRYELSWEEYRVLLEALGRPDAPEGEAEIYIVLVTRSPEE